MFRFRQTFIITLLSALLCFPLLISAQSTLPIVFYLGRSDSNGDNLVDTSDRFVLNMNSATENAIALSSSDVSVFTFDVNSNNSRVAYVGETPQGRILETVEIGSPIPTRLAQIDLTPLQIDLFDDALWLTGLNNENIPVIRGYNPETGMPLGEHTFRRPNTDVAVHSSGNWVLAYNSESGGLSVLSLPTLELVQFQLSGLVVTAPIWSPNEPQFVIGIKESDNATEMSLYVVDVSSSETRRVQNFLLLDTSEAALEWSEHGQFLTFTQTSADAPPRTALVNPENGDMFQINDLIQNANVIAWSSNDDLLLLSEQQTLAEGSSLRVLDTSTFALSPLSEIDFLTVNNIRWSPVGRTLALLGQSHQNGEFGAYVIDVGTGNLTQVFASVDPDLARGFLYWRADGGQLLFTASSYDSIFTTLGTPIALFTTDLTGNAVRLSPVNMQIDPSSIQVR